MSANAYELLKSEIVSGKRKPGEIFEEKRFAAQLGVSRTPVREAVLRLAREGAACGHASPRHSHLQHFHGEYTAAI